MLTGESAPIEAGPGLQTFAEAMVRRRETVAEVTSTGVRTKFSRIVELPLAAQQTATVDGRLHDPAGNGLRGAAELT